jgi:hypothetical protein
MMDVRPRPPAVEDPNAVDTRRSLPDEHERRASRNFAGLGDSMRSNDFGLGRELADDREQAFAKRLTQALGERDMKVEPAPGDEVLRVLAVAGLSLPVVGLTPARPEPAVEHGRLDAMIERIEKAVTARSIEALPGAVSLKLDFGDLGGSIASVTITLAPGSVDLVLTRVGEATDGPYVQAAQMLADRLHARFPKRVVRVLEAEPQRDTLAQGLAAFSQLLAPSGDQS